MQACRGPCHTQGQELETPAGQKKALSMPIEDILIHYVLVFFLLKYLLSHSLGGYYSLIIAYTLRSRFGKNKAKAREALI